MNKKAAIVSLSNRKDENIFVVPEKTINWFYSVEPGEHSIPDDIKALLGPYLNTNPSEANIDEIFHITPGSADNDAALMMCCLVRNFDTESEAEAWVYENGLEVSDVRYDGYIY